MPAHEMDRIKYRALSLGLFIGSLISPILFKLVAGVDIDVFNICLTCACGFFSIYCWWPNKKMLTEEELLEIYSRIPTFECAKFCTMCCGTVEIGEAELLLINKYLEKIGEEPLIGLFLPYTAKLRCAYAQKGRCEIYQVRPLLCRIYGAVDSDILICPHGLHANSLLSSNEASKMLRLVHSKTFAIMNRRKK